MKFTDREKDLIKSNNIEFDILGNAIMKKGSFKDGGSWFLMISQNDRGNFYTVKIYIRNAYGSVFPKVICNRASLARCIEIAQTY